MALMPKMGREVPKRMTVEPDSVVVRLRFVKVQNWMSSQGVSGVVKDAVGARDVAAGGDIAGE